MDLEKKQNKVSPGPQLILRTAPELGPVFHALFQEGVLLKAQIGATIHAFLCDGLGLDPRYVEERIQTVFLNGKAVDDPASAVVPDHATIALSAAMPGLLGATLRKGSFYAAMRSEISHAGRSSLSPHKGDVVLKLFNLLPGEIGSFLLDRGVWVKGEALRRFLEARLPRLKQGLIRAELDGRELDPEELAHQGWSAGGKVFLRVLAA